jgi:hypothetical protein
MVTPLGNLEQGCFMSWSRIVRGGKLLQYMSLDEPFVRKANGWQLALAYQPAD